MDEFGQINEQYGPKAGDVVLHAVEQLLQRQPWGNCTLERFSGPRFMFLFPDADVHYAAGVAERIRQTIEATPIDYHDRQVRLTISCAVVAAAAQETPASLCARADTALSDAKRYGRNKTFSYDGDYAAPVAAPNLALAATPVEAG